MKNIRLLQKRAVRIINSSKTALYTDPLFFKYKILNLNDLTEFNQATFIYKRKTFYPPHLTTLFKKKLGNFEISLKYQNDILNTGSL